MSETNYWYEGIEREVTSLRDKMSRSDKYLYKLDLLLETAKKVAELSSECKECQGYQNQITNLIAVVKNLPTLNDEGEIPNYSKPFKRITKHLRQKHDMSETDSKLNGIIIATVCFIGSIVLFFYGILIAIANWQSDLVPGFLISWALSLVLFIGGFVILWKTRKKPKHKL